MTGIELVVGIVSAVGTAVSAAGGIAQANFQSQVAQQQADRERQIAARDAQNFERSQSRLQAQDRARRAASGISLSTGTSLLVDEDISTEIALGRETIKAGGETRAIRLEQEARLQRQKAGVRGTAGFIKAGGTLLTAASSSFD